MAVTRGKFAKAMAPGLASIFYSRIDKVLKEHEEFINKRTSKRAYEEDWKLTGLGPFVKKNEGGVYTFDEPTPGSTIRYTHQTYGLGIRVTQEMKEDEQYGLINRMTAELGKAAALNKEVRAANVLNAGFDTSVYRGFDGLALFSTAHTHLNGSTGANRPAVEADLDLAPLRAAIEQFDQWTDDRGVPDPKTPAYLIVHPSNRMKAIELLETTLKPYGNENTVNVIASKYGIKPVVNHYLTDPDAWFLFAAKGEHDVNMFIRKDDSFNAANDPLTDDAIYTARHRISEGFGDYRGTYGSTGI